jgi:hypothetical protein
MQTQAFKERLRNPNYIASEMLQMAKSQVDSSFPHLSREFDKLIDNLHGARVDFSMRDAVGHAITRAFSGIITPECGETTIGNIKENLTYNASTSPADHSDLINQAKKFSDKLSQALASYTQHNTNITAAKPLSP